ncbi:MAG TPA: hypothetical protein VK942_10630 [Actinomycetes bacterium]|nr:hypothetical protein [Actinomycetes bacterium]
MPTAAAVRVADQAAAELDPPAWLTDLLGQVPEASRGRQTAARLHSTATATRSATLSGRSAASRPGT